MRACACACVATAELAGELPYTEAELDELSSKFCQWIEEYRYKMQMPPAATWYNLFKEVDNE